MFFLQSTAFEMAEGGSSEDTTEEDLVGYWDQVERTTPRFLRARTRGRDAHRGKRSSSWLIRQR